MVIDSSAILAILLQEPDAEVYARAIESAAARRVSAVTVLETGIVSLSRRGVEAVRLLGEFVRTADLDVVPFDLEQCTLATQAFARFGRGRHPAGLNFGDCAVYALAATRSEPLLFKGSDFAATDIEAVPLPSG